MGVSRVTETKKYHKRVRTFADGNLSVHVFKHVTTERHFYDVVVYRKIKVRSENGSGPKYEYRRGANLKPLDLPILTALLTEVGEFLKCAEGRLANSY